VTSAFPPVALGYLAFDPQVEIVQDATVSAHPLLEALRSGTLIGVIRIMIYVLRIVQLVGGRPVSPVPDFIELTADQQLVVFG
jgi:hypothetical protein